jgi:hypothetical protein
MLCCPVEVEAFATGLSLVQRSPTVYLNKIMKLRCEVAKDLTRTVEPLMMMMMMMIGFSKTLITSINFHTTYFTPPRLLVST